MPVVLRDGPFAFYFYSAEAAEPPHVHVRRDDARAKLWLDPVSLSWQAGFTAQETRRIIQIVRHEQQSLLRRWDEYFRR